MVEYYISNPRIIILAVVHASNDIANQGIILIPRRVDKAGQGMVGIITKVDYVNPGAEGRIALLANNHHSTDLRLGYFLAKNPTLKGLANGITTEEGRGMRSGTFSPLRGDSSA